MFNDVVIMWALIALVLVAAFVATKSIKYANEGDETKSWLTIFFYAMGCSVVMILGEIIHSI